MTAISCHGFSIVNVFLLYFLPHSENIFKINASTIKTCKSCCILSTIIICVYELICVYDINISKNVPF